MTVKVAVDFGTSSTCVAVSVDGREPRVANVDGQPLISSAVFAAAEGTLFVGSAAERQAAIDPARYEPHPKRRIDEGELLLGDAVLSVPDVVRAVLAHAVGEARRIAGNRGVDQLVLTHPADWGAPRTRTLHQAGAGLGKRVTLVPEPVAAAVFHAGEYGTTDGKALAVLDLGGGTVDVSVVRGGSGPSGLGGFEVLATKGDPNFGGSDIDQVLLEHLGGRLNAEQAVQWRELMSGRELAERRRRRVLHADVRSAKETLSRYSYTDVPLPAPFGDAHVTRGDLEGLVAEPLARTVELAAAALSEARVPREGLDGVFLVGGSSRIPQVARLVHERLRIIPVTIDQPETVVARGALRAVLEAPEGTDRHAGAPMRQPQPVQQVHQAPVQPPPPPPQPAYAPRPVQPVPPAASARRPPVWLLTGLALVLVIGVVLALVLGLRGSSSSQADSSKPQTPPQRISVYDYDFKLPNGWRQSGGEQAQRTVTIAPGGAPDVSARIVVEETRLDYGVYDQRSRLAFTDDLGAKVKQAGYRDYRPNADFADRQVAYYQSTAQQGTIIDWYVLVEGKVQVNIGCQYAEQRREELRGPCHTVVGDMNLRNQ